MDFSAAQRAAHAEEYADAIIAITPGFSQLSAEAQKAERKHFMREAEEGEVGCDTHFWRSADRIKKTHSVVAPNLTSTFENSLRELFSRYAIFTRWKLYSNPAAYGSSIETPPDLDAQADQAA
jgi:hypothetical protein